MVLSEENPVYGPFFGVMGAAAAIIFSGQYILILALVVLASPAAVPLGFPEGASGQ